MLIETHSCVENKLDCIVPRNASHQAPSKCASCSAADLTLYIIGWFDYSTAHTMLAFACLILSIVAILAVRWWKAKVKFARFLPRAQPYYPVIGNLQIALPFGKSAEELLELLHNYFRQHDRMFAIHIGPKVAIGLSHPELVQQVLNHPDCQEKSNVYELLRLPNGLLSSKCELFQLVF